MRASDDIHSEHFSRVPPVHIFVSYSHVDKEWFGKLRPLLKFNTPMDVHVWHDEESKAGDRWEKEILAELQEMDVFLCLVSYNFLASQYITDVEMKEALQREGQHKTVIVPLLICDMADRDIEHLKPFNPLPAWNRSWRSYEMNGGNTMDAHKPIRTGLWQAIEKARDEKRKRR
jgi:TIR domain-containing protein